MTFDDLIAPMRADEFFETYWGKRPVLLPATKGRPSFGWDHLNALFGIRTHWTEQNIKLILNSRPIGPDFYMEGEGTRLANVKQVENFMAMGASLVLDAAQQISPEIRGLTDMLADRFGGRATANFYASFQGVQAFASHFDTHEVLALHCEGRKRWRIYQNRADNPVENLAGDDAQRRIDAAKGPVMMDVELGPGDLLYIPRGYFHDAIASDGASLHLTFGFAPAAGDVLLRLLADLTVEDSEFRAYLPLGDEEGGGALTDRLARLGDRLAALARSQRVRDLVANEQRRFAGGATPVALPHRPALTFFARTQTAAELRTPATGAVLVVGTTEVAVGQLADVADYILDRPMVSIEELRARNPHHSGDRIDALIAELRRLGIITPHQPALT